MAEDTDKMLLMLIEQNKNVTGEIIGMKASITNIEENITEIKVINGGGIEVKMKTNELLKHLYEQTKAGGIIDQKFRKCSEDHSAQKRLGNFNKSAGTFLQTTRIIGTVILIIMILIGFFRSQETGKNEVVLNKRLDRIEKLIK